MGVETLPAGTLILGAEGIKKAIRSFDQAKKADLDNERLPPLKNGESVTALEVIHGMEEDDIVGHIPETDVMVKVQEA
jgi:hypothetical protein